MIETAVLSTMELFSSEKAVRELRTQLEEKLILKKHTAGIISASTEAVEAGICSAVLQAFDFPILGITTTVQSMTGITSFLSISISVMTSDDVEFLCGVLDAPKNFNECDKPALEEDILQKYRDILENSNIKNPKMMFLFLPYYTACPHDNYVEAFEKAFKTEKHDIALFGSVACSDTLSEAEHPRAIQNISTNFPNLLDLPNFLVLSGNVHPEFVISEISEALDKRKKEFFFSGEVTSFLNDNPMIIETINNRPAYLFLKDAGILKSDFSLCNIPEDIFSQLLFFPFEFRGKDEFGKELSVYRGTVTIDKNGCMHLTAKVPANSIITLCSAESSVLKNSIKRVTEECAFREGKAVFIITCTMRRYILGYDPFFEANVINSIPDNKQRLLLYSAGEICPITPREEGYHNNFQNYTVVACVI